MSKNSRRTSKAERSEAMDQFIASSELDGYVPSSGLAKKQLRKLREGNEQTEEAHKRLVESYRER